MIIFRILGRLFIILALVLMALAIGIWLSGNNITQPAGQLWYHLHLQSLQYTQVILERYLGLSQVWLTVFQDGLLQLPAWDSMLRVVVFLLLVGGLMVYLGRDRKAKSTFHN